MLNIVKNQHLEVIEVGPGKVLVGLVNKINKEAINAINKLITI